MDSQFNGIYQEYQAWQPGTSVGGIYQYGGTRPSFQQNNLAGIQNEMLFMHTNTDAIATTSVVEMAPAEYSRPTTTDATIKSGTNSLHASYLMDYYNDECLYALNTPFSQNPRGVCTSRVAALLRRGRPGVSSACLRRKKQELLLLRVEKELRGESRRVLPRRPLFLRWPCKQATSPIIRKPSPTPRPACPFQETSSPQTGSARSRRQSSMRRSALTTRMLAVPIAS